ncbi:LCP family protein [Vallitalea guaymasensis]|uniref:LCP family protein n=1 Tax=Vallitalea guaymasensis TaxID=1185412 RepID=UPI002355E987|nr:LCP family protein [Vallitalea guaymasensis]
MDNNKKVSLLTKFLKVFLISVVIFSLIAGVATGGYVLLNRGKDKTDNPKKTETGTGKEDDPGSTEEVDKEKQISTFAVFGVDKDGWRTDVTMVMTFNHITKGINIVSIPRDTLVELPTEIHNELLEGRKDTPKKLKINGIPAYAPKNERNEYSVKMIEYLFDIKIDYYFNLNIKAFKKIVDIIGPIEFEIPFDMYYPDPAQDLYINLKKGVHQLNGAQAEQLIRYRKGYANGDIGRINMQHEFMKAFVNEVLTEKNKLNILTIGSTIISNTTTNFDDLLNYYEYIDDINLDNIELYTLPTDRQGGSEYYYYDKEASKELFKKITQVSDTNDNEDNTKEGTDAETKPEEPKIISSKGLKIEVLNSSKLTGLAGRTKEKLVGEGFTISKIGNYNTEVLQKTKIIIPNEGMGEDLSKYFKDAVIELNAEALPEGVDIRIIIGTNDRDDN